MAEPSVIRQSPIMGLDLEQLASLAQLALALQARRGDIAAMWREDFFARKNAETGDAHATELFAGALDELLKRLALGDFEALGGVANRFGRALAQAEVAFEQVPLILEYLRRSLHAAMSKQLDGEAMARATLALDQLINNLVGPLARGYFAVQQAQLEARIDRLEEYHRLKDEFLSMISHELRTPLTFIQAYAETLGDELFGALNPHERDAVDRILDGVRQLNRLVEDLLETSRIAAGRLKIQPEAFDYLQLVRDEVDKVRLACHNEAVRFEIEAPAPMPAMWADPARVSQVLDNLLTNACKFTYSGSVRVILEVVPHHIETTVVDTGQGMTVEEQAGLFHKFYQAASPQARRKGGTGLGLYITKTLVELMGGAISVKSEKGRGSSFRFVLPIAPAELPASDGAGAHA